MKELSGDTSSQVLGISHLGMEKQHWTSEGDFAEVVMMFFGAISPSLGGSVQVSLVFQSNVTFS
jgi:hypothetical protein